jgi:hypothetical protein
MTHDTNSGPAKAAKHRKRSTLELLKIGYCIVQIECRKWPSSLSIRHLRAPCRLSFHF